MVNMEPRKRVAALRAPFVAFGGCLGIGIYVSYLRLGYASLTHKQNDTQAEALVRIEWLA